MAWVALGLLVGLATVVEPLKVRVATWNVADNKYMKGAIDRKALRHVMGLESSKYSAASLYDVYGIAMQENCFQCDANRWQKLSDLMLGELHRGTGAAYEYVGHQLTRSTNDCSLVKCGMGLHGTTSIFVFARRGLLSLAGGFHVNKCMRTNFPNAEKGIAGVMTRLQNGQTLCLASLHLDSASPQHRRECFQRFIAAHGQKWGSCTVIIYAGDFNVRTGPNGGSEQARSLSGTEAQQLLRQDEMSGQQPFGGVRLLDYVSQVHGKRFRDSAKVSFFPTYSLRAPKECQGKSPCYRGDRPPSWTDRIICSGCRALQYSFLPLAYSDHYPVFAVFDL